MGASELDIKELRQRVEGELDAAVAYGSESPEPTVEVMEAAVYAPHAQVTEPASRAGERADLRGSAQLRLARRDGAG